MTRREGDVNAAAEGKKKAREREKNSSRSKHLSAAAYLAMPKLNFGAAGVSWTAEKEEE